MIDKKTVEYVARLARLSLDDHQTGYLAQQLSKIVLYIDTLKELNVTDVEPLRALHLEQNVVRQDTVEISDARLDILAQAPSREGDYFKIPKVIE